MLRATTILLCFLIFSVGQAFGQNLFQRVYGGESYDTGKEVLETADEGFLVAGSSGSFDNGVSGQILLFKTDDNGYVEWRKTYGGQYADQAESMQKTADGNLIIGGYTETVNQSYQMYALKLNLNGDTIWTNSYGGVGWDFCKQLVALSDGGFALFGQTYSYGAGDADYYLVRLNADGDTLWTRTYGGVGYESGESISLTDEGGFYLTGHTESFGAGGKDVYVVKTDAIGDTIWTRTFGHAQDEFCFGSTKTTDGGIVTVGASYTPLEGDFMVHKMSEDGDSIWSRIEDGSTDEFWTDVVEDDVGNLVVTGYVEDSQFGKEDVRLMRINEAGSFNGMAFSCGSQENDRGFDIKITADGNYVTVGVTTGFLNRFDDVYLLKFAYSGGCIDPELGVNEIELEGSLYGVSIGPNPFAVDNPTIFIENFEKLTREMDAAVTIHVFNTVGQRVHSQTVNSGSTLLDVSALPSAIYSYQLVNGKVVLATGKAVKLF